MLSLRVPVIVEGKYDKLRIVQVVDAAVITTDGFGIFNKSEKAALIRRLGQNGVILLCDSDGGGTVIRSFLKGILPPEKVYDLYIPQVAGKEKRKRKGGKAGFLGVEGIDNATLAALFDRLAARHPEIVKKDVVENQSIASQNQSISTKNSSISGSANIEAVENQSIASQNSSIPTKNQSISGTGQAAVGESGQFSTGSVSAAADNKPITKTDFYLYGLTGGDNAALRRDKLCAHLALPAGMTPNALLAALNLLYSRADFLTLCAALFPTE